MSPARVAAEAAFKSQALPHVDPGDRPIVIVKRHRPVVLNDEVNAVNALSRSDKEQVEEARAPRIYRVETAPALPDGSDQSSAVNSSDETSRRSSEPYAPQPVVHSKRRRRPRKNGEVRVIRPSRPDVAGTTDSHSDSPAEAPALSKRGLGQDFVSDIAKIRTRTSVSYASIMASIQKLERQAEVIKEAEAAKAVRWIRQAIADYGLNVHDLGL